MLASELNDHLASHGPLINGPFIHGSDVSLADVHCWGILWFVLAGLPETSGALAAMAKLQSWYSALDDIGFGDRAEKSYDYAWQMLEENQVDTVIVTTMDRTHHRYIIRAMKAGCDAITEKPMTVDEEKCQQILDTIEETGRSLRVTFNYRYAPRASKVKELIMAGTVSTVLQCPPGLISLRYVFDTCTYCADRRDQIGAL